MNDTINPEIDKVVTDAIDSLKSGLNKGQLSLVKSQLIEIYNCNIASTTSYTNIVKDSSNKIDPQNYDVRNAFYTLGNLIAVPARTSATNLLKEAYAKDVSDPVHAPD